MTDLKKVKGILEAEPSWLNVSKVIRTMEATCPVNDLRVEDIRIWPIVRLAIAMEQTLTNEETSSNTDNRNSWGMRAYLKIRTRLLSPIGRLRRVTTSVLIRSWRYGLRRSPGLRSLEKDNMFFFSRANDYTYYEGIGFVDRYIDPVIEQARDRQWNVEKILLKKLGDEDYLLPGISLESEIEYALARARWLSRDCAVENTATRSMDAVFNKLTGKNLDWRWIYEKVKEVIEIAGVFHEFFLKTSPRAIFLVWFHYPVAMGIVMAAKRLGISTVDLQHGQPHNDHTSYMHWTVTPSDGYELLPDLFWVSSPSVKHNVLESTDCPPFKPIVGGNWQMKFWKTRMVAEDERMNALVSTGSYKKVILITLNVINTRQDVKGEIQLPDHLLSIWADSPKSWLWLLRSHPGISVSKEYVKSYLKAKSCLNYDFELVSALPLPVVLRHVTHHVTCCSSAVWDALEMGVASALIHRHGYKVYLSEIDKGIFVDALDKESLRTFLADEPTGNHSELGGTPHSGSHWNENTIFDEAMTHVIT